MLEIEGSLKLRNLSKTRWTARAESLKAVYISYEIIVSVLDDLTTDKNIDQKTKIQALGLEKKCLSFDFIVSMYTMKTIMYQMKTLTEQLEASDLNIVDGIVLIECAVRSLKEIRIDSDQLNKLISSAKVFSLKIEVDPVVDFQRHHRKRLNPKKIDSNSNTQADNQLSV